MSCHLFLIILYFVHTLAKLNIDKTRASHFEWPKICSASLSLLHRARVLFPFSAVRTTPHTRTHTRRGRARDMAGGYVCSLSPELVERARVELGENPETRAQEVQKLREALARRPDIPARTDDAFLLRFLRARKFDHEKTLKLIKNYYKCHQTWPDVFQDFRPSAVKNVLDSGFIRVVPQRDSQGRRIIIQSPGKWNPSTTPIIENLRAMYMTLELLLQSEETQVNGIVLLGDYKGLGLAQVTNFSPYFVKRMTTVLQDAFPMRIKGQSSINEPVIFKAVFAMIKPFLKEKMRKRMNFHGSDFLSLHKKISPDLLPAEYGGTAPAITTDTWTQTLLAAEPYFLETFGNISFTKAESPDEVLTAEEKKLQEDLNRAIEEAGPEEEWTKF
ncbi:alpha-tocopherol transfer protein-like isoform X1 [Petromyzon marinus]|uniref:Alpha-tocopherol transfer protein-like isoform X1 n=2 Tax=Petromyzon marinus TaxID=7757 RepID=A0AAJ7TH43_PETMA|nr:alpha-tocopherol transfer protein-like isoform X1 [Petromyzon marinus]